MISNCCSAPIINDDMCSKCLEHCDNILDDYPVLPADQVDETYRRINPWFSVGLLLIIIILILL